MRTFMRICLIIVALFCLLMMANFAWTMNMGLQEELFIQGWAGFAFTMALSIVPCCVILLLYMDREEAENLEGYQTYIESRRYKPKHKG